MLEAIIRKYQNLKGVYITKDQFIEDLNGNIYDPVITFNKGSTMTETKRKLLERLFRWALG